MILDLILFTVFFIGVITTGFIVEYLLNKLFKGIRILKDYINHFKHKRYASK